METVGGKDMVIRLKTYCDVPVPVRTGMGLGYKREGVNLKTACQMISLQYLRVTAHLEQKHRAG